MGVVELVVRWTEEITEAGMVTETNSIHIDATPRQVWEVMNSLNRKSDYVNFVSEVFDVSDGPVGKGTVYREKARFGPRQSISQWEFVEFDPPRRQVQESQSREMSAQFTGELAPEDAGTLLSVEMSITLLPGFRPLGSLLEKVVVKRKVRQDIQSTLSALKNLVESGT